MTMSEKTYHYLHLLRPDCPLPAGSEVVAYCRDSGGESQDRSVAQQVEAIKEYCDAHELLLREIYVDEAKQGSNSDRRERFQIMLNTLFEQRSRIGDKAKRDRLTKKQPFGVIFWKSNRLGRDSLDANFTKTDLRMRGYTIIDMIASASTGDKSADDLIESVRHMQDEKLLDQIGTDSARGLAQLVSMRDDDPEFLRCNPDWQSTGGYLSILPGRPPTGFKAERIVIGHYKRQTGRGLREVQRIVPDPRLWALCRLAWEMRRGGATLREIMQATHLYKNAAHYTAFFRNRIYTGTLVYGGMTIVDFVPRLIPDDWFEEEQARRGERGKKLRGEKMDASEEPRRKSGAHLLSGMIYCGAVEGEEHRMYADVVTGKPGVRSAWRFYLCSVMRSSRGQACSAKRVGAQTIEQAVIGHLLDNVLNRETLMPIAEDLQQQANTSASDAVARIEALRGQVKLLDKQIDNLVETIALTGPRESIIQKLAQFETERSEAQRVIALLDDTIRRASDVKVSEALVDDWIESMRAALLEGKGPQVRTLLRQYVEKVVVRGNEIDIYYVFGLQDVALLKPHLGKRKLPPTGVEPVFWP